MKKIELEDILKYRVPGNLTYSPDGKRLAFQVTEADKARNDYRTSVIATFLFGVFCFAMCMLM